MSTSHPRDRHQPSPKRIVDPPYGVMITASAGHTVNAARPRDEKMTDLCYTLCFRSANSAAVTV